MTIEEIRAYHNIMINQFYGSMSADERKTHRCIKRLLRDNEILKDTLNDKEDNKDRAASAS